jgi:hypothetical protein
MCVIAIPNAAFAPPDDALALADVVLGSISELDRDAVSASGAGRDSSRPAP